MTEYKKRAHFAHVDDFPFVILHCSAFNVLPVAVCFVSLASIVSKLRSIELSHTEFRYSKIQAVKHSLPVKVSTVGANTWYTFCLIRTPFRIMYNARLYGNETKRNKTEEWRKRNGMCERWGKTKGVD